MKKILEIIKNKWLRKNSFTILLIAIVIAIYLAINLIVKNIDITDIDITEQGFYRLSNESKNQIKNIDKKITIYLFDYEENSSIVDLAKQYSKYKDNIEVEIITTANRPDLVQKYNITSKDQENETVVFECEGRNIKASYYDFFTYDYTTYEYIDLTEQKMTNAILGVTLENAPKIYFLTGHSEHGIKDYFPILTEALESEVNEVETLDLLVKNQIPEDCKTLVIASPATDFTDYETELIIEYVGKGGNILWLSDYSNSGVLTNVQKILDLYGVSVLNDGIILEQDTSAMLMQTPDLILPTINSQAEITSSFASSGKVLFIGSGKIQTQGEEELEKLGVTITDLLTTSPLSYYRKDLTINELFPTNDEEQKSYLVGALATKKLESKETDGNEVNKSELVIYANGLFATDYPITIKNKPSNAIYFYNNQDLILNSISYLTERTETITIRKTYSTVTYTPTESEDLIVKAIIFILPLMIIVIGIVIWVKRKNRK